MGPLLLRKRHVVLPPSYAPSPRFTSVPRRLASSLSLPPPRRNGRRVGIGYPDNVSNGTNVAVSTVRTWAGEAWELIDSEPLRSHINPSPYSRSSVAQGLLGS
jgi:hypothetical protein